MRSSTEGGHRGLPHALTERDEVLHRVGSYLGSSSSSRQHGTSCTGRNAETMPRGFAKSPNGLGPRVPSASASASPLCFKSTETVVAELEKDLIAVAVSSAAEAREEIAQMRAETQRRRVQVAEFQIYFCQQRDAIERRTVELKNEIETLRAAEEEVHRAREEVEQLELWVKGLQRETATLQQEALEELEPLRSQKEQLVQRLSSLEREKEELLGQRHALSGEFRIQIRELTERLRARESDLRRTRKGWAGEEARLRSWVEAMEKRLEETEGGGIEGGKFPDGKGKGQGGHDLKADSGFFAFAPDDDDGFFPPSQNEKEAKAGEGHYCEPANNGPNCQEAQNQKSSRLSPVVHPHPSGKESEFESETAGRRSPAAPVSFPDCPPSNGQTSQTVKPTATSQKKKKKNRNEEAIAADCWSAGFDLDAPPMEEEAFGFEDQLGGHEGADLFGGPPLSDPFAGASDFQPTVRDRAGMSSAETEPVPPPVPVRDPPTGRGPTEAPPMPVQPPQPMTEGLHHDAFQSLPCSEVGDALFSSPGSVSVSVYKRRQKDGEDGGGSSIGYAYRPPIDPPPVAEQKKEKRTNQSSSSRPVTARSAARSGPASRPQSAPFDVLADTPSPPVAGRVAADMLASLSKMHNLGFLERNTHGRGGLRVSRPLTSVPPPPSLSARGHGRKPPRDPPPNVNSATRSAPISPVLYRRLVKSNGEGEGASPLSFQQKLGSPLSAQPKMAATVECLSMDRDENNSPFNIPRGVTAFYKTVGGDLSGVRDADRGGETTHPDGCLSQESQRVPESPPQPDWATTPPDFLHRAHTHTHRTTVTSPVAPSGCPYQYMCTAGGRRVTATTTTFAGHPHVSPPTHLFCPPSCGSAPSPCPPHCIPCTHQLPIQTYTYEHPLYVLHSVPPVSVSASPPTAPFHALGCIAGGAPQGEGQREREGVRRSLGGRPTPPPCPPAATSCGRGKSQPAGDEEEDDKKSGGWVTFGAPPQATPSPSPSPCNGGYSRGMFGGLVEDDRGDYDSEDLWASARSSQSQSQKEEEGEGAHVHKKTIPLSAAPTDAEHNQHQPRVLTSRTQRDSRESGGALSGRGGGPALGSPLLSGGGGGGSLSDSEVAALSHRLAAFLLKRRDSSRGFLLQGGKGKEEEGDASAEGKLKSEEEEREEEAAFLRQLAKETKHQSQESLRELLESMRAIIDV